MGSFLSAVNEFTCVRIDRSSNSRIDRVALLWLPVIGFLAALIAVSFYFPLAAPMLLPAPDHRWIQGLGYFWIGVALVAAVGPLKGTSIQVFLVSLRGPSIAFTVILVAVRATSALLPWEKPPNVASLIAELAAYLSFLVVRYHFL